MTQSNRYGWQFILLLVLLFFDYVRPQSGLLPFLEPLRLQMVMIVVLSIAGIMGGRWSFKSPETRAFLGLVLLCVVHVPFAQNGYWAYETSRSMVIYFLVYMAIQSYLDSMEKMKVFLNFWLVIGLLCSLRGLAAGGKIPGSGFLGDENDFALYLTMMLPIAYVNILGTTTGKVKLFNLAVIAALFAGIVASFSRGGFVGFVGVALYGLFITPKKLTLVALFAVIVLVTIPYVPSDYKNEISTIFEGDRESTASERLYLWKVSLQMFYDNPLVGVGPGNYPWRVMEYEPLERHRDRGHGGRPAHSLYFTLLPELGLAGFSLFCILIYAPFANFRKFHAASSATVDEDSSSPARMQLGQAYKAVYGCMFGFLFSGLFLSVLYYPHFWLICALLTVLSRLSVQGAKVPGESAPVPHGRFGRVGRMTGMKSGN